MTYKIIFWGDSHIPYRAEKLPFEFLSFVESKKNADFVIVTGDLVVIDVLEQIKKMFDKIIAVRGNMDEGAAWELPIVKDLELGQLRITVFHGHGIYPRGDPMQLYEIARKRRANIIITGHTHYPEIRRFRGILILNPGSVCGVYGGSGGYGVPTWGYMEIEDNFLRVKIFEIRDRVEVYDERTFEI